MNIENKKQFATILLAVGLGLIAVLLTSQYVQNKVVQQTEFLAKDFQKKNAVLINELELMKKEVGRVQQEQAALAKAQQQLRLVSQSQEMSSASPKPPAVQMAAFSVRTPPGKRALTISIESLAAVGGLVNPGDFVDILAHLKVPMNLEDERAKPDVVTTVLFQNIQVLAVGTNFKPLANEPAYDLQQKTKTLNVTLAVTPEEAGLLTFAEANGTLQLALRAPAEESTQRVQVASWESLSEFVKEKQGTELVVPESKATVRSVEKFSPQKGISVDMEEDLEEEPKIQIFRGGRSL